MPDNSIFKRISVFMGLYILNQYENAHLVYYNTSIGIARTVSTSKSIFSNHPE